MTRPGWLALPALEKLALALPGFMKPAYAKHGLAALLALLLAAELLLPGAGMPTAREGTAIPAAMADQDEDADISQWGGTILARPLFNADRRPANQPAASTVETLPRLSAIIITASMKAAIFAAPGQKPQSVGPGGGIDGYQLQSIAPDRVEMLGPDGGTLTLRLQRLSPSAAATANNNS